MSTHAARRRPARTLIRAGLVALTVAAILAGVPLLALAVVWLVVFGTACVRRFRETQQVFDWLVEPVEPVRQHQQT
jgi:hypothetical protein